MDKERTLIVSLEYGCYPLWWRASDGGLTNFPAHELPISTKLAEAIETWGEIFENTYNSEYPPNSGFSKNGEEQIFWIQGQELITQIEREMSLNKKIIIKR